MANFGWRVNHVNILILCLPKSVFFYISVLGGLEPGRTPPPNLGCVPVLRWLEFSNREKTPNSSPTICKNWGCSTVFCMYSAHLFQLWSQKLAPLRCRGFVLNLLWRFFLNIYSSWQINILFAYSAISPQAIRTVVCFLGGVWWSA